MRLAAFIFLSIILHFLLFLLPPSFFLKSLPLKQEVPITIVAIERQEVVKPSEKQELPEEIEEELALPEIDIPLSSMDHSPVLVDKPLIEKKPEARKKVNLASEVATLDKNIKESNEKASAQESAFYKITGARRVLNSPPPPEFALQNDSTVIALVTIDKSGRPYNISFKQGSTKEVELLARDYIYKLRFSGGDNNRDVAEITLYFKVR